MSWYVRTCFLVCFHYRLLAQSVSTSALSGHPLRTHRHLWKAPYSYWTTYNGGSYDLVTGQCVFSASTWHILLTFKQRQMSSMVYHFTSHIHMFAQRLNQESGWWQRHHQKLWIAGPSCEKYINVVALSWVLEWKKDEVLLIHTLFIAFIFAPALCKCLFSIRFPSLEKGRSFDALSPAMEISMWMNHIFKELRPVVLATWHMVRFPLLSQERWKRENSSVNGRRR